MLQGRAERKDGMPQILSVVDYLAIKCLVPFHMQKIRFALRQPESPI